MHTRIPAVVYALSAILVVFSTEAGTVDYRIDRMLEVGDPLRDIEDEVRRFKGSAEDFIVAYSPIAPNGEWTVENAYRCMRMYSQQLQTLLWQQMEGTNNSENAELNKRIEIVIHGYRTCAEAVGNSILRNPQIVELSGDLAYFDPTIGKNAALMLHYKAYCLGLRSESILRKLALDLKVMHSNFDERMQGSGSANRKVFLFSLDKRAPDASDREMWLAMAQWFDKMATRKNVLVNEKFFTWWDEKYGPPVGNLSGTGLVMAGLGILYEQMVRYEADLLVRAERGSRLHEAEVKAQRADEDRKAGMGKALDTLTSLKALPNNLDEIESVFGGLMRYRSELNKTHADIPGYEDLKKVHADTEEAEVLNLFYSFSVNHDYDAILKRIPGLKTAGTDVRVLFLELFCQAKLSPDGAVLQGCVDRILKLDPDNRRAKHMKIELEAQAQPAPK